MTTQSPHRYVPQSRSAAAPTRPVGTGHPGRVALVDLVDLTDQADVAYLKGLKGLADVADVASGPARSDRTTAVVGSAVPPARTVAAGTAPAPGTGAGGVQTRLPWWGVALPAVAFALLLALLGAGPADASTGPASTGAWLARLVAALPDLVAHLL